MPVHSHRLKKKKKKRWGKKKTDVTSICVSPEIWTATGSDFAVKTLILSDKKTKKKKTLQKQNLLQILNWVHVWVEWRNELKWQGVIVWLACQIIFPLGSDGALVPLAALIAFWHRRHRDMNRFMDSCLACLWLCSSLIITQRINVDVRGFTWKHRNVFVSVDEVVLFFFSFFLNHIIWGFKDHMGTEVTAEGEKREE